MLRLGMVAGEVSGDLLGAGLVRALQARVGDLRVEGIAGPRMQALGCVSHYPMERLSVMGLFEVLGRLPELLLQRRRLARRLLAEGVELFVGVDAPDYNLGLERHLRRGGVRTVHYVSPSVWAWRRYRLRRIARSADLVLALLPFEAGFYERHGVPVRFVGHPLADAIPLETPRLPARARLGLPAEGELVALLPGSRVSEVRQLAAPLMATARWLAARRPGLRFAMPLVNPAVRAEVERCAAGLREGLDLSLLEAPGLEVMAAADVVLLACGTAALEAMLLKRPMVVAYRLGGATYALARHLVHLEHYSLPNLLAGRALVPELIQNAVVPERMGPALLRYLQDPAATRALLGEFERLHRELARGASERAAEAVLELAGRGAGR